MADFSEFLSPKLIHPGPVCSTPALLCKEIENILVFHELALSFFLTHPVFLLFLGKPSCSNLVS